MSHWEADAELPHAVKTEALFPNERRILLFSWSLRFLLFLAAITLVAPEAAHASCKNLFLYERDDGALDFIEGHIHNDCRAARTFAKNRPDVWCEGKKNCRLIRSLSRGQTVYISIDGDARVYALGSGSFDDTARDRAEAGCRRKGGTHCMSSKVR